MLVPAAPAVRTGVLEFAWVLSATCFLSVKIPAEPQRDLAGRALGTWLPVLFPEAANWPLGIVTKRLPGLVLVLTDQVVPHRGETARIHLPVHAKVLVKAKPIASRIIHAGDVLLIGQHVLG